MASGYLIPTRFDVLYRRAIANGTYDPAPAPRPFYGIPTAMLPEPMTQPKRYRGIDREPLCALSYEDARLFSEAGTQVAANDGMAFLSAVEAATGREDGWITSIDDALKAWELLGEDKNRYEVLFGREVGDSAPLPPGVLFLGCDAAYFVFDHFSCICDALFFPRWHGTDKEGVLFQEHFNKLNANGLFDTNDAALAYLKYYLSFDWTERAENFTSIELYAVGG
jgi:hypothetical protein